jgi:EF hand
MKFDWKQASALAGAIVIGAGMGFAGAAAAADYGTPPSNQAAQPGKTMAPADGTAQPGKAMAPAEGTAQPGKTMAPAEGTKIAAPSKAETADAAFKKLDASGKGYVTADDAKALPGFDKSFQANDANHDGKLTLAEFKKAWEEFTGNKS